MPMTRLGCANTIVRGGDGDPDGGSCTGRSCVRPNHWHPVRVGVGFATTTESREVMATAWEDAVNAGFVETVGQYLADGRNGDVQDREQLFDELLDAYEMTIGELPDPTTEEDENNV